MFEYSFAFLQAYEDRSHVTIYLPVNSHSITVGEGKKAKRKETELIATVSNWHFNREAQKNPDRIKCRPNDCHIGFKFSSTEFATQSLPADPPKPGSNYKWDRHGLSLSYSAFADLLADKYFTGTYMTVVKDKFEEKTKSRIAVDAYNDDDGDDNVDDDDLDESYAEDDLFRNRKTPTAGTSSAAAASKKSGNEGGKRKTTGSKRARFPVDNNDDEEEAEVAEDDIENRLESLFGSQDPAVISEEAPLKPPAAGKTSRQTKRT